MVTDHQLGTLFWMIQLRLCHVNFETRILIIGLCLIQLGLEFRDRRSIPTQVKLLLRANPLPVTVRVSAMFDQRSAAGSAVSRWGNHPRFPAAECGAAFPPEFDSGGVGTRIGCLRRGLSPYEQGRGRSTADLSTLIV